jgi:O-antigen ligase
VWLVVFVGLAFTGSRAGLIAALAAALIQGALIAVRRRRWRASASGLIAGAIGLGVVAIIGLQQGLGRWLGTSTYELAWNDRLAVYRATLELWQRAPLWGWGLGAFRVVFPAVQPGEVSATVTYWHAHNDWLELLATTGIAGAALVLAGLAVVVARLSRLLVDGARSEDVAAAVAALGAITAVAVHSCFDFGLTMPANPIVLAVILGSAVVARTTGDRDRSSQ